MPGPSKILNKFKVLSGTARSDRDAPDGPEFETVADFPDPPQHLNVDGVLMWNTLGKQLVACKVLQVVDFYALEQLAYAWQQFRKKAKADMEVTASETNALKGLFDAFGLNPAARRKVAGSVTQDPKKNKFANNAAKARA